MFKKIFEQLVFECQGQYKQFFGQKYLYQLINVDGKLR